MKKDFTRRFLSVVSILLLVFAVAGQASAYFEDLQLIRSIYTTTGEVEVGSALGFNVSTFKLNPPVAVPTAPVNQLRTPNVALSLFDGTVSSLYAGYWAHDAINRDFYATGFLTTPYGGTDTDGLTMLAKKQAPADAIYNSVQNLYSSSGTSTTIVSPKTMIGSYFQEFDRGYYGSMGSGSMGFSLKNDSYEMTLSLADLGTKGFVDQILYKFDYNYAAGYVDGLPVAIIRTFLTTDGNTIDLNGTHIATLVNPVPIPTAFWLLGSGIAGLASLRRKVQK